MTPISYHTYHAAKIDRGPERSLVHYSLHFSVASGYHAENINQIQLVCNTHNITFSSTACKSFFNLKDHTEHQLTLVIKLRIYLMDIMY